MGACTWTWAGAPLGRKVGPNDAKPKHEPGRGQAAVRSKSARPRNHAVFYWFDPRTPGRACQANPAACEGYNRRHARPPGARPRLPRRGSDRPRGGPARGRRVRVAARARPRHRARRGVPRRHRGGLGPLHVPRGRRGDPRDAARRLARRAGPGLPRRQGLSREGGVVERRPPRVGRAALRRGPRRDEGVQGAARQERRRRVREGGEAGRGERRGGAARRRRLPPRPRRRVARRRRPPRRARRRASCSATARRG